MDDYHKVLFSLKLKKYRPTTNLDFATITNKRVILRSPSILRIKISDVDYSFADITNRGG